MSFYHSSSSFPIQYNREFTFDTDASDCGLRVVLSQIDEHSREMVIAYGSCLLSKLERLYCISRRELLAAVISLTILHAVLFARHLILQRSYLVDELQGT